MKPIYVISDDFDYDELICRDAGPGYSEDLELESCALSELESKSDFVPIFDLKFSEIEWIKINSLCSKLPTPFVFRIVDPYYPSAFGRRSHILETAFSFARDPRCGILSPYQPADACDLLYRAVGCDRFHVSPYPYLETSDLPISSRRLNKIIISGNDAATYPLRAFARRKRFTSWSWRRRTDNLSHPGYSRKNANGSIGEAYLKLLAKYQMMLLCPASQKLEFLKYRECGSAGCCPVGEPPLGLSKAAAECIIPFGFATWREDFNRIREMGSEEVRFRAEAYRAAMKISRSSLLLRARLYKWIEGLESR